MEAPLVEFYQETEPTARVLSRSSVLSEDSNVLFPQAKYHNFVVINSRRIEPSSRAGNAPNSIIQMEFGDELFAGQVISIVTHMQSGCAEPRIFLHVRWFRSHHDIDTSIWDP